MSLADSFAALAARWRADAEVLRRRGCLEAAALLDSCAADLGDAIAGESCVVVSPAEAARLTGFSAEHIARLIRRGKLPNLGRKHAPRVRLADVPRKAGTLPGASGAPQIVGATRRELARAVANG